MTWTKLSDDYSDDCWTLTDSAFRLHTEALIWSNRKLLDCVIPQDDLRRFAKNPDAVGELISAGWWSDQGDRFTIRHHATYQRAKDDVVKIQERNQKNGASGGRPPKPGRELTPTPSTPSETQVGSQMETQRDRTGQDRPGQEEEPRDDKDYDSQTHSLPSSSDALPAEDLAALMADGYAAAPSSCGRPDCEGGPSCTWCAWVLDAQGV